MEPSAVLSAATEQQRQSEKNITTEIAENAELSQIYGFISAISVCSAVNFLMAA